jgi:predicted kinase
MAGKLIVLVGNVGTGKSRFRKSTFNNKEIIICPDTWEGSKDELQRRMILEIEAALKEGKTVVVDGNNLTRQWRVIYLYFAKNAGCDCVAYDFGAGDDMSLQRRLSEPYNLSASDWTEIHLRNQKEYEKPDESEGFTKVIHING